MASVNKWIGIGHLGADPETRYLPSGEAVTNIRIACTDKWKDKQSGEQREQTEWVSISFFGKLAEIAGQYLLKGSQVYIEGKLNTRKYMDKDGVEKYATGIKAEVLQMLGGRSQSNQDGGNAPRQQGSAPQQRQQRPAAQAQQQQPRGNSGSGFDDMDDSDIPF